MTWLVIGLRVVHILGGIMWAGAAIFMALWFEPSVREAGPAGAPVMAGLEKHRYFVVMPVIAILTLISGGALFYRDSAHLNAAWMGARPDDSGGGKRGRAVHRVASGTRNTR